jgi:hypothetical protein
MPEIRPTVTKAARRQWLLPAGLVLALAAPVAIRAADTAPRAQSRPAPETDIRPGAAADPAEARPEQPADTKVVLDGRKYDLARRRDLDAFVKDVKHLRSLSKDAKAAKKDEADDEDADATTPPAQAHKVGRDWGAAKVRHGLKALEKIAVSLQAGKSVSPRAIHEIQEIAWAVESNFHPPYFWRTRMELLDLLYRTRGLMLNASGRGNREKPAADLSIYSVSDLSKVDPKPSSFWSPPPAIPAVDLYRGCGRKTVPDFSETTFSYAAPHKSYGLHPSFEVEAGGKRWKVKFGEERSSGPFACRVFGALGYPVETVDYLSQVRVHWDRRILTDFNARKLSTLKVTFLGIPVVVYHDNPHHDPFDFIKAAILKDGSHIDARQLRANLLPGAGRKRGNKWPEQVPGLYDRKFEAKIDTLVMGAASITPKDSDDGVEIGSWDYSNLGHSEMREVRGMAVLDAWLDNWDVRWGNNRLKIVEEDGGSYRLVHCVTDLGALFGNSGGMVHISRGRWKKGLYQNEPNDYEWAFTHPQPEWAETAPIRGYMPDSKNKAFYEMNIDDARWMARHIAQLSEEQIKAALIGAGYDAVEARLLLEKMVARRDQMVKDFGLSAEIPPLRPRGVDKRLSYDPETDGSFVATLPSGEKVVARSSGEFTLRNGRLTASNATLRGELQTRR